MRKQMILIAVIVVTCTAWGVVRWLNARARPYHRLGVQNGQLAECPDKPNCVSSTSPRPQQNMPPIPLAGSSDEALSRLESIMSGRPHSRIATLDDHYLHAEFRSRVFGFVDDIEFLIDEANAVIHFRAAARVGYYDLDVNRRRMTQIREQFAASQSSGN
jgi:uncharacterized protein (DUF1499 family)